MNFKKNFLLFVSILILSYGLYKSETFEMILAGVAIFLFGMIILEKGFRSFAGGILEKVLKISTDNMAKSISFGFVTTTLMQSSSLVSVITISFLSAGLIDLIQGIGIIYGANIGTTTGAWLMAGFGLKVKISAYAMPMLIFGVILIFQKNRSLQGLGHILAGLGFLFLGIHYMKEGFEAFKDSIDLAKFAVSGFKGLILFIGIGIIATLIMQSSHATIILVIAALSAEQVTYENAIALIIGANIGTTITAIIGSLSSNIDGKRLAGAHLIFNLSTAIIAVILMNYILQIVDLLSDFLGIDEKNYTLRVAVFDTFFKTMGVIIAVPFTKKLMRFLHIYLKDQPNKKIQTTKIKMPKYLNDSVLQLPETAFASIIKESKYLYDNTFRIMVNGINIKKNNLISTMDINEVLKDSYSDKFIDIEAAYNADIKTIYSEIIDFATNAQLNMPPSYIDALYKIKVANRSLIEALKNIKHLQKNIKKYTFSSNKSIKQEYENIRKNLALLLRDINIIATTKEEEAMLILLTKIKNRAKEYDYATNGTLDNLIRNDLITSQMASSLLNDSVYVANINHNLIQMAQDIFVLNHDNIANIHDELIEKMEN